MAQIPNTALSWQDMADPAEVTLANGDTLDFRGEGHVLLLRNPTGAAISPVLMGSDATFVDLPGVGRVSLSGGYAVGAIAAGATIVLPIGVHYHWLAGAVTLTNCAGLRAVSLEDARGYRPADLPFSPAHLFRRGEIGLIVDPSRLDTLFQDAAGAIPATGPGQPVGLVLNTLGGSIKPAQGVSASRPTLGRHPRSGRRNLLTRTEDFTVSPWQTFGTVVRTADAALAPDGTMTADKLEIAASSGVYQNIFASPSRQYNASIWMRADVPTTSSLVSNSNPSDPTIRSVAVTTEWQRISLPKSTTSGALTINLQIDATYGANTIYVWGAQLELGSTATPYQRATTQYDVTESGQPDVWYLDFDGIDDGLDASFAWGSDAVTAIAAIHKRTDAASGNVMSFGAYNAAGGWRISAPVASGQADFGAFSGAGSNVTISSSGDIAPTSAVVSMRAKTQAPLVQLRRNGQQVAESVAAQGSTLAYAAGSAAVLQIGRWYGSDPLNGRIYGLIAINRALSEPELMQASRWLAGRIDLTA